jgi:phosphohistidine phosphatase
MLLYVVRHGIAISSDDPACPPDRERALTEKGTLRTTEAARGLRRLGVRPRDILTSPLRRAVETARIVARALRVPRARVHETAALEPASPAAAILGEVRRLRADSVLVVGHAPNLDLVIGAAVTAEGEPVTELKKVGAACVELDRGRGRIVWVVEPKALRRLGR